MPAAAQATVTIKHFAAALAEQHELAKKQSQEILNNAVGRHCHVNRKFADQMTMAVTVHAATVAWRHVSIVSA